ncbi:hypothetical protein [Mucilaginibacter celer]|uniref:Uncharacterized protein n=1 Tax=Mucilaginibacter celer TaxID=2305508 RepID=A0A494VJT4_9SPHI|nr:hypothetical protein [Mucilaginibacter celer]AYL94129.1 hypothetical protein HYN43_001930 [Mucilaginibacter celer]
MNAGDKHYKCVNSKTGYAIYYHSLSGMLNDDEIRTELEKIRARVAIQNGIYLETLYWEEMKQNAELTR